MINKFKELKFDIVLRQAYENSVIMSGVSAGLICWFEKGITDSYGPLTISSYLGWL